MKKLLITAFLGLFGFSSQCGTIVINPIFYIMSKIIGSSSIQGSGIPKTQHLPIEGIRHISASGMGSLFIKQCENPQDCIEKLTITADDNILDFLQQKKRFDKLELGTKDNVSLSIKTPIEYHVIVKNIHSISQSGLINITTEPIVTETLAVTSFGGGTIIMQDINAKELKIKTQSNIKAHIETDILDIDQNGNNTITLEGHANHQEIRLKGNIDYQAKDLESNSASFSFFGNGNIHLNAKEEIKGSIYGNASGTYNGKYSPEVNVKTYGLGRFKKS